MVSGRLGALHRLGQDKAAALDPAIGVPPTCERGQKGCEAENRAWSQPRKDRRGRYPTATRASFSTYNGSLLPRSVLRDTQTWAGRPAWVCYRVIENGRRCVRSPFCGALHAVLTTDSQGRRSHGVGILLAKHWTAAGDLDRSHVVLRFRTRIRCRPT